MSLGDRLSALYDWLRGASVTIATIMVLVFCVLGCIGFVHAGCNNEPPIERLTKGCDRGR